MPFEFCLASMKWREALVALVYCGPVVEVCRFLTQIQLGWLKDQDVCFTVP